MHELSIARNIVEIVCRYSSGTPVRRVRVEIGELSGVSPEAILFCFDICARDTPVEGAELEINSIAARGKCCDCQNEMALDDAVWVCACGSRNVNCVAGFELKVKEMEVA